MSDLEIDQLIKDEGISVVLQEMLNRIRSLERRVDELEDANLGA